MLEIRYLPLNGLVPYARNARTHSAAQILKLKASLVEYGWTTPMAVAGNKMIAGHGRLLAAIELASEGVAIPRNDDPTLGPTVDLSHLTPTQQRAYVIADNRLALDAGWDSELLTLELHDLQLDDFDMSLTGFDLGELDAFFAEPKPPRSADPDEVPDLSADVVSRRGDVWLLGEHRLACGDSTSGEDVARLMQGEEAALCFTSPPYAQQRAYATGAGLSDWDALMQGVFAAVPMADDGQILVNLGLVHKEYEWQPYWEAWIEWMRTTGWRRFGWYVWDQGFGLPGAQKGRLANSFEFVFHFNRKAGRTRKTKHKQAENIAVGHGGAMRSLDGKVKPLTNPNSSLQPTKIPDSVIRITRQTGGIGKGIDHPAVFPVKLPVELIATFTDPGMLVYEPFSGSGTTIIAAEQINRRARAMEIAPEYVDVAIKRFEQVTEIKATLAGDGRTFAEIAAERAVGLAAE